VHNFLLPAAIWLRIRVSILIYFVYRKCRLYSACRAARQRDVSRHRAKTRRDRRSPGKTGKTFPELARKEEEIPLKNYTNNVVIIVY